MNVNFKFGLGDKVVVPHISKNTEVVGEVDQLVLYRDGSIHIKLRWGRDGSVHDGWFVEKELKMSRRPSKPKPKPRPKPKPIKKKTAKQKTRGMSDSTLFG